MPSRRFLISGRVQGVFFRASTRKVAVAAGLAGWAWNLADGKVEVVARGEADKLDRLHRWLLHGPPMAHVTEILTEDLDPAAVADEADFHIR